MRRFLQYRRQDPAYINTIVLDHMMTWATWTIQDKRFFAFTLGPLSYSLGSLLTQLEAGRDEP